MADIKEIRDRMQTVKETQKITNAMYLIASNKMRKAKADLDQVRPYFTAVKKEVKRIFRTVENTDNRYFYPDPLDREDAPWAGTYAYLVITADRGLAGAYNQNVLKETKRLLAEHKDARIFVVGDYGRQHLTNRGIPFEQDFYYDAQHPTFHQAREISALLLDLFDKGKITKLFVIYTDYGNGLHTQVHATRLLPFHKAHFTDTEHEALLMEPFEFLPSLERVVENTVRSYVSGFIYSALIDSYCCEQNERMTAMEAANRNARKLLEEMTGEYNRLRQNTITQEITETASGAKYQKRLKSQPREGAGYGSKSN